MSPTQAGAARAPGSGRLRLCVPGALALGLCACAQTGDFGRRQPGVFHDALMPAVGSELAYARDEPVSGFRMTDDEHEMRDLAWGVVMPPLDNRYRDRLLAELRRTRILPANRARLDRTSYVRALIATDYRSSVARYARLKEDVLADIDRIEPFFASAAKVDRDDRARRRAVAGVPDVTPAERENALARIDENGLMIAWTRESFDERLASYRFALDRLVLETPDRASVEVAAALDAYAAVLASLRPLGPPKGVFKG